MTNKCEDCPNEFEVKSYGYKRMYPNKCQTCARRFNRLKMSVPTHGQRRNRTPLYVKWVQMRCACYTITYKDYRLIGAKGIRMHESWLTFEGFYAWALPKYFKGMRLKRIDVTKDFDPENCKFIKGLDNKFYEYEGVKKPFQSWKNFFNSSIQKDDIIRNRLERGWDLKRAFTENPRYLKESA